MARPTHRAIGGINAKMYWNGVFVGMVQNATFNRVFNKIAVNEVGTPRTREHVYGGVVCTISIGFVELITKTLQEQKLLPSEIDEDDLIDFEGGTCEFRTVRGNRLIIQAEDVTVSNDSMNFTRDTVWGHNVNFDATWFKGPQAVGGQG